MLAVHVGECLDVDENKLDKMTPKADGFLVCSTTWPLKSKPARHRESIKDIIKIKTDF